MSRQQLIQQIMNMYPSIPKQLVRKTTDPGYVLNNAQNLINDGATLQVQINTVTDLLQQTSSDNKRPVKFLLLDKIKSYFPDIPDYLLNKVTDPQRILDEIVFMLRNKIPKDDAEYRVLELINEMGKKSDSITNEQFKNYVCSLPSAIYRNSVKLKLKSIDVLDNDLLIMKLFLHRFCSMYDPSGSSNVVYSKDITSYMDLLNIPNNLRTWIFPYLLYHWNEFTSNKTKMNNIVSELTDPCGASIVQIACKQLEEKINNAIQSFENYQRNFQNNALVDLIVGFIDSTCLVLIEKYTEVFATNFVFDANEKVVGVREQDRNRFQVCAKYFDDKELSKSIL